MRTYGRVVVYTCACVHTRDFLRMTGTLWLMGQFQAIYFCRSNSTGTRPAPCANRASVTATALQQQRGGWEGCGRDCVAHNVLLYTRKGKGKSDDPCSQENVNHSNSIDKCSRRCFRAGEMAQPVNCLPSTYTEHLSSISRSHVKMMDMVTRPSTMEVEAGAPLELDGQPV